MATEAQGNGESAVDRCERCRVIIVDDNWTEEGYVCDAWGFKGLVCDNCAD